MSKKKINIQKKYRHEIQNISNKLNQLKQGRIYELSHAQMDRYLATNKGLINFIVHTQLINDFTLKSTDGEISNINS